MLIVDSEAEEKLLVVPTDVVPARVTETLGVVMEAVDPGVTDVIVPAPVDDAPSGVVLPETVPALLVFSVVVSDVFGETELTVVVSVDVVVPILFVELSLVDWSVEEPIDVISVLRIVVDAMVTELVVPDRVDADSDEDSDVPVNAVVEIVVG